MFDATEQSFHRWVVTITHSKRQVCDEDFSRPNPDGVPSPPTSPAVRIAEAYKLRRQPVEALGALTAQGLFLWRFMGSREFRRRVTLRQQLGKNTHPRRPKAVP